MVSARRSASQSEIAERITAGLSRTRSLSASARAWVSASCRRSSASWASTESSASRARCRGSSRMSATQLTSSAWIRPVTASLSRGGAHHGARSPITSATVSGFSTSQPCSSSTARSTSPWCRSSWRASESSPPSSGAIGSSRNRGVRASRTSDSMWSSRTLVSAMAATSATSSTTRRALAGSASQTPTRRETPAAAIRSRMIGLLEEVLAHELLEPPAEVVLALRDQGGVRDRQPERVLEESRHREPVRDRAHHRRLGAGVHEPEEPDAVPRHDVHHRGEQQEPHRDRAHPPQARAAERVSSGISCDEGCGDGHSRRFSRTA